MYGSNVKTYRITYRRFAEDWLHTPIVHAYDRRDAEDWGAAQCGEDGEYDLREISEGDHDKWEAFVVDEPLITGAARANLIIDKAEKLRAYFNGLMGFEAVRAHVVEGHTVEDARRMLDMFFGVDEGRVDSIVTWPDSVVYTLDPDRRPGGETWSQQREDWPYDILETRQYGIKLDPDESDPDDGAFKLGVEDFFSDLHMMAALVLMTSDKDNR